MDSNKDESERCIKLAETFLEYGEVEQALKYLTKAQRLYPSQRAQDLIDGIESPESAFSCFEESPELPPDAVSEDDKEDAFAVNSDPVYTDEQLLSVQKITKCKDFYDILGVAKDCSDEDLKKSYKKLALRFHPDKNRAPGATEAFKAISSAFGILSNPSKRRRYDQHGCCTEVKPSAPRRQPFYSPDDDIYDFAYGYEGDISADELFKMFFGAAFKPAYRQNPQPRSSKPTHRQSYTPRPPPVPVHRPAPPSTYNHSNGFLLQLSPIIFLVVLSLLSTLLVGDSAYSLHQDSKFSNERSTRHFGVAYFVCTDFETKYPTDGVEFLRVEQQVEDEHVSNLQYHCYRERSYRENMMWRARMYHNDALYKQARDLQAPSCEALQSLRVIAAGAS